MTSLPAALLAAATLLTNCIDVTESVFARRTGESFRLVGTARQTENNGSHHLVITDASGGTSVHDIHCVPGWETIRDGDTLCVSGVITRSERDFISARARAFHALRHGSLPAPVAITAGDLSDNRLIHRDVSLVGRLVEVFRDEIDSRYVYASLDCDGSTAYLSVRADEAEEKRLRAQRGAAVEVTGTVSLGASNARRVFVRTIGCSTVADIRVITPAPGDPFACPPLESLSSRTFDLIPRLKRRRLIGTVTAVYGVRRLLLRTDDGETHGIRLAGDPVPARGARIEAVGLLETDLYNVNLADADWRGAPGAAGADPPPQDVTIAYLLSDGQGHPQINPWMHGKPIRVEGTVIDQPVVGCAQRRMTLKDDELLLPVDLTSAAGVLASVSVGCRVAVTGICIVEAETWRPFAAFPHATGLLIAPRSPDDIAVLARPPWWTPQALLAAALLSLALAVLVVIWNRALQRIIVRKSRQLLKEQTAKISSELRTVERTALAVELHDALSQNLSGVACQVAAAKEAVALGPDATRAHLGTAERMLLSCRTELRRCLRDLRSDALEETDFTAAVRKVLAPVAIGVETSVRFNVPRVRVSDTTAHAVLCIVRELAANAIRHGRARRVWVAGEYHDHSLSFSVRDDGAGFDPAHYPGPAEGHFGLEGIRERVRRLNGTFSLRSAPGSGTRAAVFLHVATLTD